MEAAWGKAKRPRNPQRGPAPLFLLIIALALIGHGCAVVKSGNPSSSITVSNPSVSNITSTGASVSWTTNVSGNSQVEYGTTVSYGQSTAVNPAMVTNHTVDLSGLTPATQYHFRVKSQDSAGHLALSGDSTFSTAPSSAGALNVSLTAKESAGVGVTGYPVTVVVPMPYGTYQNSSQFHLVDASGATIPAQFEVIGRWWAKDNSIRHVMVHFQTSVSAFTGPGTGTTAYALKDNGGNVSPPQPVTLSDDGNRISISTGVIQLSVNRSPFRITMPSGALTATFTGRLPTDVQSSFDRSDVSVSIEESGPMRAVIRAEAPTLYSSAANHTHGWALRVYAYAGKPFVKVDYQLQNSAKTQAYAAPLYFKSVNLQLATGVPATPSQVRADMVNGDFSGKPLGALKAGSMSAIIRNFWQMWPNGLSVDANGLVNVELWPSWSAQFYNGQLSPLGLYWMDDMQQTYKEVLLNFGSLSDTQLSSLAKTFQFPPVVTIPVAWYATTKATLDLGGVIPITQRVTTTDLRTPTYDPSAYNPADPNDHYAFGWDRFAVDTPSLLHTCNAGGWPYSNAWFLATENPADYFEAQDFAIGEINVRPQWIAQYNHERDYSLLKLSEAPYCGETSWRKYDPVGHPDKLDSPYLPGSGRNSAARDDQHGWFYHMEEAYWVSGNPWIKDWYQFVGQFRRVRLNTLGSLDWSSRAIGHSLHHAMQAYRVTGDTAILPLFKSHIINSVRPTILPTGAKASFEGPPPQECTLCMGYLSRAIINYLDETPGPLDPDLMGVLDGFVNWNMRHANFSYFTDVTSSTVVDPSSGTGFPMADPQVWYALKTGQQAPITHVNAYIDQGIPAGVGAKPYADMTNWTGDSVGRLTMFIRAH